MRNPCNGEERLGRSSVLAMLSVLLFVFSGEAWAERPYANWANGPSNDPDYFPIGVWLQDPADAATWMDAGVNVYTGLWQGPTAAQLDALVVAGMQVIAVQNSVALAYQNVTLSDGRPLIIAYEQGDEPDNFPQTPASAVQAQYAATVAADPSRPVFLNLGQGIGWDDGTWIGQGGVINPEVDYPAYYAGSDIGSFDIYPMDCGRPEVCGDAWRVALGVDRIRQYSPPGNIVWNFIETGDIHANGQQATVDEIKAEIWMSIIHGSLGINYFIHGQTSVSDFDARALLRPENADRLAAVTAINNQIHELAPVINSASLVGAVAVQDLVGGSPVDVMAKEHDCATFLFAAGMGDAVTTKIFQLSAGGNASVEVLGEGRQLTLVDGQFIDTFDGYEAHLYKINVATSEAGCAQCAADLNGDGTVDVLDLIQVVQAWGDCAAK